MFLTNLTSLPSLLPLTTLTALLLTAEWSVDTPAARRSIALAETLTSCPSVQFLELSITPDLLHSKFRGQPRSPAAVIHNLTANPPYLPHLRVLRHTEDADITQPYADSFDPPAVAKFLSSLCGHPFPKISSRDTISVALRNGKKAAILVDDSLFTMTSNQVFDVLESRPDWVIGFASEEDIVFRERHGAKSPSIVLVDRNRDVSQTISLNRFAHQTLNAAIDSFENFATTPREQVTKRVLRYFQRPGEWRQHFEQVTRMGLDAWMGDTPDPATIESFLWVIVMVPWCGFCQRAMPEFERFRDAVREVRGVHAVIVDDGLPSFLDNLVDGYPTVLIFREHGNWSGVVEYLGKRNVWDMVDVHYGQVERALRLALGHL